MLRLMNPGPAERDDAPNSDFVTKPGLYSERAPGDSWFVTMNGRNGEPLAYFFLADSIIAGGELPPELKALYERVVGRSAAKQA